MAVVGKISPLAIVKLIMLPTFGGAGTTPFGSNVVVGNVECCEISVPIDRFGRGLKVTVGVLMALVGVRMVCAIVAMVLRGVGVFVAVTMAKLVHLEAAI